MCELHWVLPRCKLATGTSFDDGPAVASGWLSSSACSSSTLRVCFSSSLRKGSAGSSSPSLSKSELEVPLLEDEDVSLMLSLNSDWWPKFDSKVSMSDDVPVLFSSWSAELDREALDLAAPTILRRLGFWNVNPNGKEQFFRFWAFLGAEEVSTWETALSGKHRAFNKEPMTGKVYSNTRTVKALKGPHFCKIVWKIWWLVSQLMHFESESQKNTWFSGPTVTSSKTWSLGFKMAGPRMKFRRSRPNLISNNEPVFKSP